MSRYVLSRAAQAALVVVTIAVVVFLLLRISPGDPATIRGGVAASPATIAEFRADFGVDRSLLQQLGSFASGVVHGDLGTSFRYNAPVLDVIADALPHTLLLGALSLLLSLTVALLLGVRAAQKPGSFSDGASSVLAALGQATPVFWLGLLLIQVFAVQLGWFPSGGFDGPQSLVLPAVAIAFGLLPAQLRVLRASMREALAEDYVRTAHAFGLPQRRISYVYALRNAALPVLTVIGVDVGYLLGGVIVAEAVFNFPGIGQLAIAALGSRDYPLIQALAIGSAAVFVVLNLVIDLLYSVVDPRVRLGA